MTPVRASWLVLCADAHVGTLIVITPEPCRGKILYLIKALKEVLIEPVVAHCPVIPLNISILLWVPRLDIAQTDSPLSGLVLQPGTEILRPLLQRISLRQPRHSIICSRGLTTRSAGREKSISIPNPSRLKSSITFNSRMLRPFSTDRA